jgi:hypothetical protein
MCPFPSPGKILTGIDHFREQLVGKVVKRKGCILLKAWGRPWLARLYLLATHTLLLFV